MKKESSTQKRTFNTYWKFSDQTDSYQDRLSVQDLPRDYKPGQIKNKNQLSESFITKFIMYSSNRGDTVLDPFAGSFSTGRSSLRYGRKFIGFELNSYAFETFVPTLDAVEEVMDQSIKTHHHGELKVVESVGTLAGALPALGIVACVLGVVKTMGKIDQPPPVLGALIGGALVGTFLGVFFAYGLVEPMSKRMAQIVEEEGEIFKVVKQIIIGTMHGHPMPLIIEAARVSISHHNQPSFAEVFDGMRGN